MTGWSPKHDIKQPPRSIIHFHWHQPVSRCTLHTSFAFPVEWNNQFHSPACFISLIKSWHCQLSAEYLRVQFMALPGNSWKARRDQLAERSGISYSDHAKCQQDNLIICDPGVGRKIREAVCRICKRANAKCQTNIGRDEVSRQSQISVGIQRASILREVDCNTWVIKTARSDRLFILLMRNKWLVFLSRMIFFYI